MMSQTKTLAAELCDRIRIRRIEAIRVALPLAKPMLMAGVRIETAENVLVRIEAADGTVGWGEATSAPTMTGDLAESLVGAVRHLTPLLIDQDARMHALLARRCLNAMHGNGGAKSAIDMALLDLVGRRMGMPTIEFLGGPLRETVTPMWLLGNPSVADDIAEAKAKRAEGFSFFKLKVGIKPVAEEIEAAALLRKELGPDVLLCADANAGLELSRALQFVRRAGDLDLLYLEQPVRAEDLTGMQALAAIGTVPICADEGIAGAAEVLAHDRARAMSGINLKLMKAGGPRAAMRVAALCEALGLSMTIAGKIAESSISASNTLAVACAVANVAWGVNLTHIYLAEDLVRKPIQLQQGVFARPLGPGNGVDVDEAIVARYRVA
jgi:L-alanine-DL-glutamate epimerase-like enolase superfamily enzyme